MAWLREELGGDSSAHDDVKRFVAATGREGMDIRRAMVSRLLQIAFTDEAIVIGKDSDGELLKRISSRESLEAIKTLWLYDIGKPREVEGPKIQLPEGLIRDSMSLVDIAAAVYRWRLTSGQMGEAEFAEMVKLMLSVDQVKLQLLLRLLGKDSGSLSPDEVLAKLNDHHEPAAQIPGDSDGRDGPGPAYPASDRVAADSDCGRASGSIPDVAGELSTEPAPREEDGASPSPSDPVGDGAGSSEQSQPGDGSADATR